VICDYGGDSMVRYAILDERNLAAPVTGETLWSQSALPTARHEAFVPNDDPKSAPGLSDRRGDGRTVLEGRQGKLKGRDPSSGYTTRTYTATWDGKKLVYTYGPWESD